MAVLVSRGLVVDDNEYRDAYKSELAWSAGWATEVGLLEARDLASVVASFKATMLVGTSGQPGIFNEEIVQSMAANTERPFVLPLSNPTETPKLLPNRSCNGPTAVLSWQRVDHSCRCTDKARCFTSGRVTMY